MCLLKEKALQKEAQQKVENTSKNGI